MSLWKNIHIILKEKLFKYLKIDAQNYLDMNI